MKTATERAGLLLLCCTFMGKDARYFHHLANVHRMDDSYLEKCIQSDHKTADSLPCSVTDCSTTFDELLEHAPKLMPMKVGEDPRYKTWRNEIVIPLHYHDKVRPALTKHAEEDEAVEQARSLGHGGNGQIARVWIEPSLHTISGVRQNKHPSGIY